MTKNFKQTKNFSPVVKQSFGTMSADYVAEARYEETISKTKPIATGYGSTDEHLLEEQKDLIALSPSPEHQQNIIINGGDYFEWKDVNGVCHILEHSITDFHSILEQFCKY